MPIQSRISKQLGLKHPLICAPMAGVSGGLLAGAASKAGGLGFIAGGYGNEAELKRELGLVDTRQIGVGFISWALDKKPWLLDMVLERGIKALFLSFGDISPYVGKAHAAGVPVFAQVQTVQAAKDAVSKGADIIIAQGSEAGGHGASRGTITLLPAILDHAGQTPVAAAGGITDGRSAAAAFLMGAQAIVCGTAFYASPEALSHDKAKDIAVKAQGDDTFRSSLFDKARGLDWPAPYTLRTLRNSYSDAWLNGLEPNPSLPGAQETYAEAVRRGDFSRAAVIVGEGVDQLHKKEPAAAIIERLMREAEHHLRAAPSLIIS
ncbi:MAG: nitronate monooxygenase [Sphingomonadales bacterium]|jgi:nitronate monooxygenase